MKKNEVALWLNETIYFSEDGDEFSENEKHLIGWFNSYQEAKRYIRNEMALDWSSRKMDSYKEYDCYGWFPGAVMPQNQGVETLWKVSSFLFQKKDMDVEYDILRPLDWTE